MDNFIFLPDRSKVSAGNSATGELSVALGKNCIASGDYSVAMGFDCSATGNNSFADGSGCTTNSLASIAMGRNCHTEIHGPDYGGQVAMGRDCSANGWGSVAMGNNCSVTGAAGTAIGTGCVASSASVALGSSKAYAFNSVAIGEDNETNGWASVAMGSTCKTDASYNIALGKSADASGTGGFVYRSNAGNTFVFDDAGPSLKINGSVVASGASSGTYGYKMITTTTSKPGGGTWNGSSCSVLDITGLSLSDLTPTTRCKITMLGAGGGGGAGEVFVGGGEGSGGGGGGMCIWSGLMDASWTRVGTLILGAGGIAGTNTGVATAGGDTSWPAITSGGPPTYIISGGGKGFDYVGSGAGGAGGVPFASSYLFVLGVDGWRAMGKADGLTGKGTQVSNQGGVGGAWIETWRWVTGRSRAGGCSLAFAPGAGGYPGVAGEDGQFGTGGGGGGNTTDVGRYGGAGGDACMLIEWWL